MVATPCQHPLPPVLSDLCLQGPPSREQEQEQRTTHDQQGTHRRAAVAARGVAYSTQDTVPHPVWTVIFEYFSISPHQSEGDSIDRSLVFCVSFFLKSREGGDR